MPGMTLAAPLLVGVAGASCSGKTSLAAALQREWGGRTTTVVAIDSYHHDRSSLAPEARAALNFDEPDAIAAPLLVEHVRALLSRRAIRAPVYDFATHSRSPGGRLLEPRPVIVVEGLFALYWPELLDLCSLRVFVETPRHTCFERRLHRDVAERGRTAASVQEQFETTVWPMFLCHVEPTKSRADIVVDGAAPIEAGMRAVLERIGPVVEAGVTP